MGIAASRINASLAYAAKVLTLFLPIALMIGTGLHFLYQKELRLLTEERADHEEREMAVAIASIQRTLQSVNRDLVYLATRDANRITLDSLNSSGLDAVGADWVAFSQAKKIYDKIRWIDENGMERLRVDYYGQGAYIVSRETLSNKSDRYFFKETIKLNKDEIYVSPLDLNFEDGVIEMPNRPTIRIGMPVYDRNGDKHGIVLVNYSANHLFSRIEQVVRKSGNPIWLLDQDSYWLKGPTPQDEFGFMLGKEDLTMRKRYPDVWERISNENEGQFETSEGLWTFGTIFPLLETDAQDKAVLKGYSGASGRQYLWKTVSFLPKGEYVAGAAILQAKLGATAFLLLVIFLVGSERIVRARQREKQLLIDLTRKEERLRTLIRTVPDMLWLKDAEGVYISCNPSFERFFGLAEGSIVGKTDFDLFPICVAELLKESDQVVASGKTISNEEWLTLSETGQQVLLQRTKVPVKTPDGELIGILGIGTDITERKRIENELRESHDLLVNLTAQVPGIIYQFRLYPDGRMTMPFISETAGMLYGISPDDVRDDASLIFSLCHPDDIPILMKSIHKSAETMEAWNCEFRVLSPEGKIVWRRGDAKPQRLEDGSTLWHGYISNITDRKLVEEDLRLAAMVYRHSGEAMMIIDAGNLIAAVNPAFEEITGYCAEEVIGKSPRMLSSGRHGKALYRQMIQELDVNGQWEGDLWKRRKDGEVYITRCRVNTIHNEAGSIQRRVALFSDITRKKQAEELVWQHANFDQLTGLPNRRMFMERLRQETKSAHRRGGSLALLFLDLDHFKDINDTLGHDSGDLLLREAAQRLQSCVRESDMVARLGGDEFTLLLGHHGPAMSVERVVNDILKRMSEPFKLGDEFVYVSASIGATFFPQDAGSIDDMLKNADQAMYAAKQEGRNRCRYFTSSMQEAAQNRMRMINDLRQAVADSQFHLMYQPIVDLTSGTIHKAEALIRWQHPQRGTINPAEFIGICEDTGMIMIIGDWVFRTAAMQAARWRKMHDPAFQVSVNISPVQFRSDGMDLPVWFDHLHKTGSPAEGIVVEITEGLLLDACESVTSRLLAFRNAGIEVALDDFGTGYSSLSYLKKFDIDYLKIDKAFVNNLGASSEDLALCEAIIVMAHKLGLKVIAEGVETKEQRDILAVAGCDFAQGYYFSSPVDAEVLEQMLESQHPKMRRLAAG